MNVQPQEKPRMTPEEYLELERNSENKHEYFDGEVFAMVGAKRNHNLINTNTVMELGGKLKSVGSTCRLFSNDMKVKVQNGSGYVYPDIVVACSDIQFEDEQLDVLTNPVVIMEILSDSTEAYDRGTKFHYYRLIPSLQEYILISQNHCRVEQFIRGDDGGWKYFSYEGMGQSIRIESIDCDDCELSLSEIYWEIEFKADTLCF